MSIQTHETMRNKKLVAVLLLLALFALLATSLHAQDTPPHHGVWMTTSTDFESPTFFVVGDGRVLTIYASDKINDAPYRWRAGSRHLHFADVTTFSADVIVTMTYHHARHGMRDFLTITMFRLPKDRDIDAGDIITEFRVYRDMSNRAKDRINELR